MNRSKIESAVKILPDLIKEVGNYLKTASNDFLKNVSNNNGTIGLIVKVFGQPMIDKYYKKINIDKLENLGINTYIKASLSQVEKSLNITIGNLKQEYSIDALVLGFDKTVSNQVDKAVKNDWVLFFQPKFHPIVVEVELIVKSFLETIKLDSSIIIQFEKHFFEEIESTIFETFGQDLYEKHIDEIKAHLLKENEAILLRDNIQLSKIGFKESESLSYEETYGKWEPVFSLFDIEKELYEDVKNEEINLKTAGELVDQYFNIQNDNHLEKILFVIADFGKGKSVFLKHYAATLSKEYLLSSNNYFPIYFNLRTFKDYSEEHQLGVLGNYLEFKYGIKLNDDYFQNRRYVFLIDSLDECGELTSYNIDKVINSIKKVQNINPSLYKFNKIIITSRPFDDGLRKHLENHNPFTQFNKQGRPIEYFLSLYGFKKEQFNKWLTKSIRNLQNLGDINAEGLNKEIVDAILNNKEIDAHKAFIDRNIISHSELRRPIFAYMIFQLISNSINFDKAGKIGVYLSFLNLLTKEAKYLHDLNYKINLTEQFEARNILHSTAAVWLYNKNYLSKSELNKADICRALEGENTQETDNQILKRFKDSNEVEIQFLSHSYFGESNNRLHFQHQSFAEILLAEYYLKIILKFAFDEEFDYEQARIKLSIGQPTLQTIDFLKELLSLLKDSVEVSPAVLEKRKLLFPLLAALATKKNNKSLYSNYLYYTWYNKIKFEKNNSDLPEKAITEWPIGAEELKKISELSRKIIDSDSCLSIQKGEFKTSIFNKEVFISKYIPTNLNIDKWISLVCGNLIYNNELEGFWFNGTLKNPYILFEMIVNNSSADYEKIPSWGKFFFKGINLNNTSKLVRLDNLDLRGFDFSNSILVGISFIRSFLGGCNFENCSLSHCDFSMTHLRDVNFKNVRITHYSKFALSNLDQGILFPYLLAEKAHKSDQEKNTYRDIFGRSGILVNYGDEVTFIKKRFDINIEMIAKNVAYLLKSGFEDKMWSKEEILEVFVLPDKEMQYKFRTELLNALEK